VDISGKVLDDEKLRRGKVILVFTMTDCEPCNDEAALSSASKSLS
jgi:hypothetical protein